jgi:hypothetical protein
LLLLLFSFSSFFLLSEDYLISSSVHESFLCIHACAGHQVAIFADCHDCDDDDEEGSVRWRTAAAAVTAAAAPRPMDERQRQQTDLLSGKTDSELWTT